MEEEEMKEGWYHDGGGGDDGGGGMEEETCRSCDRLISGMVVLSASITQFSDRHVRPPPPRSDVPRLGLAG